MRVPRERSHFWRPPETTVSTTSLTVPPNAFLTSRKSSSSSRRKKTRRCGPISTLSGVAGAGLSVAHAISPTPSSASRVVSNVSVGRVAADAARPASSNGVRTRPRMPRAARSSEDGSGCGRHGSPSCGSAGGFGSASNSTVARSTPAMPSTSAWWVFEISAKRSPSSPWTSHVSHSGLARSSCCEWMRAASERSCASDPGDGSAVWRMWYSRLKLGSFLSAQQAGARAEHALGPGPLAELIGPGLRQLARLGEQERQHMLGAGLGIDARAAAHLAIARGHGGPHLPRVERSVSGRRQMYPGQPGEARALVHLGLTEGHIGERELGIRCSQGVLVAVQSSAHCNRCGTISVSSSARDG